ncbi:uncharacterized protein LOC105829546 [Monomorium pharaonis]|uniref:uncharacterized protein LOC105829546 n=1 Tax=Monomorium pharaonis TaxID=307658 RepID=UPI00063EDD56|nr:uncharacterized protein LOC105829546 [Monomorium pharaonis]XP_012523961.1 uncharacterized protein LOC105829546 [Monomorium pharaonis]
MGLKWFRARLSIEKEQSKIPEMTGQYRRFSYSESTNKKNVEVLIATPSSVASDSSDDNETIEYDRSKTDLASQTSSSIIDSEEMMIKENVKKPQIINYMIENAEPSTSIKDPNVKEQSIHGEISNKTTKDQNDTKSPILDNELVI